MKPLMDRAQQAATRLRAANQLGILWGLLLVLASTAAGQGLPGAGRPPSRGPWNGPQPDLNSGPAVRPPSTPYPSLNGESGSVIGGGAIVEPRGLVVGVQLAGNRTVKDTLIRQQIKTKRDRMYDPRTLQDDVRRLYATKLFHDVRVQKEQRPEGVLVTFQFVERPTIDEVKFIGNRKVSDRSLRKQSGLVKGDALNVYAVQEAVRKMTEFYESKGLPKTSIEILEGDQPGDQQVVFLVNEGRLERIWDVKFVGNSPEIVTDSRLKTQIQSKPGFMKYLFRGTVSRQKIDEDVDRITAYYRNLGYFRARVGRELQYDESGQWLTLTFVIDEGPRYKLRNVTIEGNSQFEADELIGALELKQGDYFQLDRMQVDQNTLRDIYGSQGFVFADVQAMPQYLAEPGQLDLVYKIDEGDRFRVGKIRINVAGEYPHTKQSVILNRLSLRPGDIIDIREVRASERRLKASQLFETNPTQGDPPRIVIVPPELGGAGSGRATFRGQSPDGGASAPRVRNTTIDLHLPALKK